MERYFYNRKKYFKKVQIEKNKHTFFFIFGSRLPFQSIWTDYLIQFLTLCSSLRPCFNEIMTTLPLSPSYDTVERLSFLDKLEIRKIRQPFVREVGRLSPIVFSRMTRLWISLKCIDGTGDVHVYWRTFISFNKKFEKIWKYDKVAYEVDDHLMSREKFSLIITKSLSLSIIFHKYRIWSSWFDPL